MLKRSTSILLAACTAIVLAALSASAAVASVETARPGWEVTSAAYPTNLPSGGSGHIELGVYDVGAAHSAGPVTVVDTLPPGVKAISAGYIEENIEEEKLQRWDCTGLGTSIVTCTSDPANLPSIPYQAITPSVVTPAGYMAHIGIAVTIDSGVSGTLSNYVTVSGGGASTPASVTEPITFSTTPGSSFGFEAFDGWFANAEGSTDTQAGSHPYDVSFSFYLNNLETEGKEIATVNGLARNMEISLPPGIVGNPTAVPQCPLQQFEAEQCPVSTQIGLDTVTKSGGPFDQHGKLILDQAEPAVFNLVPPPGVPAQFGFLVIGIPVVLDASVRSGGDYGITEHVSNVPQNIGRTPVANTITLWGEPANPAHDAERYADFGVCETGCSSGAERRPFLTMPTSCGPAQAYAIQANTWETNAQGGASFLYHDSEHAPVGITGCDRLGFKPSISVAPDTTDADTPAGLTVEVKVPQEGLEQPEGLATSNIKDTTVTLPQGLAINPGQASGLVACQPSQDGLTTEAEKAEGKEDDGPPECPSAAKVGTVQIATPLLKEKLEGNVYVLQSDPPNLKLLVAASGEGVNLKLVGDVHLNEQTGQLVTTFNETPELPFTDFKLSFSGGAQAALATPTGCGAYTATSDFTPWSTPEVSDAFPSSDFQIAEGPDGGSCVPSPLPFSPELIAGATSDQAGGFTSFSMLLQRGDGQQRIERLQFEAPPGLGGMLSTVPQCQEPQAAQGTCSSASQIGHATVESGPGPYPLVIPQPGDPESPIYLTGPYDGAPFGLTIVTHVIAGPFNLGTVITRAKIEVDPHTAQIIVTTDPLPQVVAGVPTDLRLVNAVIDRPMFMFNPTNCDSSSFSGTAWGTPPPGVGGPGASAPISSHFQVGSCRSLEFTPKVSVGTSGRTSRADGASLTAKVTYPSVPQGTDADIGKFKVDLPKQLPSRLTTLQKACTAAQFEANPADCPAASFIGHAVVHTPEVPVPLEGPAIFVSHGGEAFPSLTMVLQGDGVTIELVGATFISKAGVTSTTFNTVPDAPFSSFELTLPEGPYSALAANGTLCSAKLAMPTVIVGQNGAEIHESTPISVGGCAKTKALTRAQKLTKALKACKKRKNKSRRATCEKQTRKKYGAVKKKANKSKKP